MSLNTGDVIPRFSMTPRLIRPEDRIDVTAFGVRIRLFFHVSLPDDARARIREVWQDAEIGPDGIEPDRFRGITPYDVVDLDRGISDLTMQVTLDALDHARGRLVLLHACGIAADDGRVLALVGPSGRGKTTASRVLGRHYGYVTDETVGVTEDGGVLPYRKPLSVLTPDNPVKDQLAPTAAGLRPLPTGPLRLASLGLLDRQPGSPRTPTITRVPLGEAIGELVPQLSYLPEVPSPLSRLASLIDSVGGCHRVTYSEAADLVDLVPELLDRSAAPEPWHPTRPMVIPGPGYRPVPVIDAIETEDGLCLLFAGQFRILDGIAPVLWEASHRSGSFEDLTQAVVQQFGSPPDGDPAAIVASAVDELVSSGVLELR